MIGRKDCIMVIGGMNGRAEVVMKGRSGIGGIKSLPVIGGKSCPEVIGRNIVRLNIAIVALNAFRIPTLSFSGRDR